MITTENYYSTIADMDFSKMPKSLRDRHAYVNAATKNGASWQGYDEVPSCKAIVDEYFRKLDEYLELQNKQPQAPAHRAEASKAHSRRPQPHKAQPPVAQKTKPRPGGKLATPVHVQKATIAPAWENVERISEEVRIIKRFANMHDKWKTKDDLLRIIKALQKAVLEKRIRKASPYAQEIMNIQEFLIKTYNAMGAKIKIDIPAAKLESFLRIGGGEKVMPSINFIKKYINLNGKKGMKEKAKQLLDQLNKALENGTIANSDTYIAQIRAIKKDLQSYLGEKSAKVLEIETYTLNGLQGIVNGCACQHLDGLEEVDAYGKPAIMNSIDFANLHFDTLGFKGKWRELIGDPTTNFTMMVFGKPKMGKSFLCIDLAGYLARNHGIVLYVAREEGLDKTLQDKLNDKDVMHENLYVSSVLPANLSLYNFIILDSVNKLGLTPEDLNRLKAMYPDKTFIFVFQTTKDGKFRGANTFQHDVDSVIEIPERGKAVQYGRFNQGGEMQIF